MKYFYYFFIFLSSCFLQACSHQPKITGGHLVAIKTSSFSNSLFYSGTVQPLKTLVVPCPEDGVVIDKLFQYGESIDAGHVLFTISSAKFQSDYKSALVQYVKAKSDFNSNQTQLTEGEFLHKNLLISDDDFKMRQANFYAAQLTLLQAKDVLDGLLHQINMQGIDLYKLTISDVDKITQAIHSELSDKNLQIIAPASGVVLSPAKSEDESKKIMKGDAVKQGDVLAEIGDMSGISVRVKVNELTINQLKVGQKVKVTGIAFPDDVLEGAIDQVDRQGDATNGGMPTFNVDIVVPKLTAEQQKLIHVGMSTKVEIDIEEEPQIMIPINAVRDADGITVIKKYNEKTGKILELAVKTGKTTEDSVAILSGLHAGDKIVVPD